MALTETCLDKISRITQNPNLCCAPRRTMGWLLQQLHSIGMYHIPEAPVLRNWDGDALLHLKSGELLTRRLWFLGYVQYDEEYFLRSFLRSGMTVIDAGANVGHIAVLCGRRVRPSGTVHSFEPVKSTFEFLRQNVNGNGLSEIVRTNQLALSNTSGDTVKLDYCDLHSFLSRLSTPVTQRQVAQEWSIGCEDVTTVELDEYVSSNRIGSLEFLKVDVEGAESLVLEGAGDVLRKRRPTVLCEFNHEALERLGSSSHQLWDQWASYGYLFFDYSHRKRTLIRCKTAPQDGAPTYVGTTDPEWLASHIGARIV